MHPIASSQSGSQHNDAKAEEKPRVRCAGHKEEKHDTEYDSQCAGGSSGEAQSPDLAVNALKRLRFSGLTIGQVGGVL
jgi:hypothetical protein